MKKKEYFHEVAGNGWVCYGDLPFGCQLCEKGLKIVFFMGGDCAKPRHCSWYCPISQSRKSSSAFYIDEIPITDLSLEGILETIQYEQKMVGAKGISITGGDPLFNSRKKNLTIAVIRSLKAIYGEDFHIHLYTSGKNFDAVIAEELSYAGLDSIRFHPARSDFNKIEIALDHNYQVGAEVPVIPTEEEYIYLFDLADYLDTIGADFMNLNEFEMCAANQKQLLDQGFTLVPGTLATVEGSAAYARKFLNEFIPKSTLVIHFCTVAMKDSVQIRQRYQNRATHIKYPFERITEDGTLVYLQIEGPIQELKKLYDELINISLMPSNMLQLVSTKGILKMPDFLVENDHFLEQISDFQIKVGVVEILPFHETNLQQIVEYQPIINNL